MNKEPITKKELEKLVDVYPREIRAIIFEVLYRILLVKKDSVKDEEIIFEQRIFPLSMSDIKHHIDDVFNRIGR